MTRVRTENSIQSIHFSVHGRRKITSSIIITACKEYANKSQPVHWMNAEQRQATADRQIKPTDLGHESAWRLLLSVPTIATCYYYSARKLILIRILIMMMMINWDDSRPRGEAEKSDHWDLRWWCRSLRSCQELRWGPPSYWSVPQSAVTRCSQSLQVHPTLSRAEFVTTLSQTLDKLSRCHDLCSEIHKHIVGGTVLRLSWDRGIGPKFFLYDCSLVRLCRAVWLDVWLDVCHVCVLCQNGWRYCHSWYEMRTGNHTQAFKGPFSITLSDL